MLMHIWPYKWAVSYMTWCGQSVIIFVYMCVRGFGNETELCCQTYFRVKAHVCRKHILLEEVADRTICCCQTYKGFPSQSSSWLDNWSRLCFPNHCVEQPLKNVSRKIVIYSDFPKRIYEKLFSSGLIRSDISAWTSKIQPKCQICIHHISRFDIISLQ